MDHETLVTVTTLSEAVAILKNNVAQLRAALEEEKRKRVALEEAIAGSRNENQ